MYACRYSWRERSAGESSQGNAESAGGISFCNLSSHFHHGREPARRFQRDLLVDCHIALILIRICFLGKLRKAGDGRGAAYDEGTPVARSYQNSHKSTMIIGYPIYSKMATISRPMASVNGF